MYDPLPQVVPAMRAVRAGTCFIGRSAWAGLGDTDLSGRVDEFRVYRSGHTLVKHWSNTGQIPSSWSTGLVKHWSNTGQILVKYRSSARRRG
jgi:hypothetical protein